jgi:hypothetical protein
VRPDNSNPKYYEETQRLLDMARLGVNGMRW